MEPEYRPGYFLSPPSSESAKEEAIRRKFEPFQDVDITMDELMNGPIEVRMAVLKWRDPYDPPSRSKRRYGSLEVILADYPLDQPTPFKPLYWDN
ncbi:hypothetical protein HY382_02600 [Candidatus Curtissbacteria bacterium]|nr:hypothetical protein [Candidatus Curtissbacteria bacterium]